MPVNLTFSDAALRIALTLLAGALVGFNRGTHNEAAGMRTTMLVSLAACMAMVMANFLLHTTGKDQGFFTQIDVLRLPLGILSGIGFIGAGAIIKKKDMALGVTTAACMWFMTVVGLCFGAGLLMLGAAGTLFALIILWALKWFDQEMRRAMEGRLKVSFSPQALAEEAVRETLRQHGYRIMVWGIRADAQNVELETVVQWQGTERDIGQPPAFLPAIKALEGLRSVSWEPAAGER